MTNPVTDSIFYVGENDHDIDLFESQYQVPNGMAYNSYVILDEKIAVMDTIDQSATERWLGNVKQVLAGRNPDYLVIQHMEPDHSASIQAFLEQYPQTTVVGNVKTFNMIKQFFPDFTLENTLTVKNGETLPLGSHTLQFIFAPMVHWPEVMTTYETSEKVLFSADAFGKFGALDVEDPEGWDCEARRYYFGIVSKYGRQVQMILKKAASLNISKICPLHGPVLTENLEHYLNLYQTWSSYQPETPGVCICYTSVYGHTRQAVELLRDQLVAAGVPHVTLNDLARFDIHEAIEEAFQYDKLVLATTTYSAGIFPAMKFFLDKLIDRDYQNRTVALIENGSWAPLAAQLMREMLDGCKNLTYAEPVVTIRSAMTEENRASISELAQALAAGYHNA